MTTGPRLQALVAVAETGSVRAAAERLVVTESAVSSAVTALAREIGVPLVTRAGRGLQLTDAGAVYADYARRILGLTSEASAAARAVAGEGNHLLRLGAVTTAGEHLMPDLVSAFRARHPGADLRLTVEASAGLWAAFRAHEVDLVIAGRPPDALTDARTAATRDNDLVLVAAPGWRDIFGTDDPWSATWLMREPGSGTRATAQALLDTWEASPPQLELGSNGAVIAGARAGLGVSLVSTDAVDEHLRSGELVVARTPGLPLARPWHATTHRQAPPTVTGFTGFLLSQPRWHAPRDAG